MALALTYDNLPPGSTILREWDDGTLILTAGTRELDAAGRSRAARRAALEASWTSLVIFVIVALLALSMNAPQNTSRLLSPLVIGLSAICFGMLFLLHWHERWRSLRDATERGLDEQTVLMARADSLQIELEGRRRSLSLKLCAGDIFDIEVQVAFIQRGPDRLLIRLRAGETIELLLGRSPTELEWVAKTLRQIIDRSTGSPPEPGC